MHPVSSKTTLEHTHLKRLFRIKDMLFVSDDAIHMFRLLVYAWDQTFEVLPAALERLPDLGEFGESVATLFQIGDQSGPVVRNFFALFFDVLFVAFVRMFRYLVHPLQQQVQLKLLILKNWKIKITNNPSLIELW